MPFFFSFLEDALDENVCYVDVFFRLRDVQFAFGILFRCFVERPFYLLCALLPLSSFRHQLNSLNLTFMKVFKRLLGLGLNVQRLLWCIGKFHSPFLVEG